MGTTGLSIPSVSVNNDVWRIIPNSFKFTSGRGTVVVRSESGGGGDSQTIHTTDAESQIGKCSFDLSVTKENLQRISSISPQRGSISIEATQKLSDGSSLELVFPAMSLMNDPEAEATADGKISLEFEGDPMVAI